MDASNEPGAVVISGASTGIGAATAIHLDQLGYRVFAGVRRNEDGERLCRHASSRLVPVLLDVTDADSITSAVQATEQALGSRGLAGLICNAGVAVVGPLEFLPRDELRRQVDVNLTGLVAVTQAFLPQVRKGGGRIINIGSTQGMVAFPFFGMYAATKFALEAVSAALRLELKSWNIPVILIEPGRVKSDIGEKVVSNLDAVWNTLPAIAKELYGPHFSLFRRRAVDHLHRGLAPDVIARTVARALTDRRPKLRYLTGIDAWRIALAARFLPDRLRDKLLRIKSGLGKVERQIRTARDDD